MAHTRRTQNVVSVLSAMSKNISGQTEVKSCAYSESFVRGCPTLTTTFFIIIFISLIREKMRPLLAGYQRPASETRYAGGQMMDQD